MDARQFFKGGGKTGFIRKHELRAGPRRVTVAAVEEGDGFPPPDGGPRPRELQLAFTDGSRFSLGTAENMRRMAKLYGNDTDRWVGQVVELYFSPDVPNPKNPGDPGGVRIRVPDAAPSPGLFVSELDDQRPVKGNGAEHPPTRPARPAPLTDDDVPL